MDPASIRASDRDRMDVAKRLEKAMSDGFIDTHEFDERTQTALQARTRGELVTVLADLPPALQFDVAYDTPGAATNVPSPSSEPVVLEHSLETLKQGAGWVVPQRMILKAWGGSAVLNFAEADIRYPRIEIELDLKGSSARLYLPEGSRVEIAPSLSGNAGTTDKRASSAVDPLQPVFIITGRMTLSSLKLTGPKRGWWD